MQNIKRPVIAIFLLCLSTTVAMLAPTSTGTENTENAVSKITYVKPEAVPAPASLPTSGVQNVGSFHFIEPLAPRSGDPAKFDPSLLNYLSVEVCVVTASDCTVVKAFSAAGSTSERLRIESNGGWTYYIANWDTQKVNLNNKTYRVRVNYAGLELGSVDLTPDVYTRFGRTWPIKFLIEKDPALRVRLVRYLGQSCSKAASVLKLEFGLSASEAALVLAADPQPCSESEIQIAIDGVYQDAIIPDTTKVSDDSTRNALLSYDNVSGRMVFSTETVLLKRLNVNDVLASEPGPNAPSGYLRKISSKRKSGGQVILETVQAKLTEAITRGHLNASGDVLPNSTSGLRAIAPAGENNSLTVSSLDPLDEGDNFPIDQPIDVTINFDGHEDGTSGTGTIHITGFVHFKAGYNVGIGIEDCFDRFPPVCVDRFEAWAGFEQRTNIRVTGDFHGEVHKEKVIFRVPVDPIVFFIGPVPIVLVPKVEVVVGVNGEANIHFVFEAEATSNVKVGAKWTDPDDGGNDWENILEKNVLSSRRIEDDLDADLHVEAGAKLDARIFLYDLLGPGMDGAATIGATVQTGHHPFWSIDGRLTAGVNFGAGVDGLLSIGTWEQRILNFPFNIAEAVNSPPVFSRVTSTITARPGVPIVLGPLSGTMGEEGFFAVSDPEGDPFTLSASSTNGDDTVTVVNNKVRAVFPYPGTRTVNIIARDADGAQAPLALTVNVENLPPEITFTTFLLNFPAGVQYFLTAHVNDPETGTLPCSSLMWEADAGDLKTESVDNRSCTVAVVFSGPGTHNIRATAVDPFGSSASRTRTVNVTAAPANPAPVIDVNSYLILAAIAPLDPIYCSTGIFCEAPEGAELFNGEVGDYHGPLTLSLTASDPQGETVSVVEWRCLTGPGSFQVATNNGDGTYTCNPSNPGGTIAIFAIVTDGTTQIVSEVRTFTMRSRLNPN